MKTNEKKKVSPLEAVDLPTGACRAGFRMKAVILGATWGDGGSSFAGAPSHAEDSADKTTDKL